ncbi:hypothetical protein Y032_0072g676 [Ancylostoma ceylanicum]|uniref:Uncharacterized protein n=1 Tax=Ancylostoma ceylanicum TaxID=53326 RepID=A0A016TWE8_9BILA|nr:hypothetical protein Y032_0072g676 [Ancylostoma ceylanicum]
MVAQRQYTSATTPYRSLATSGQKDGKAVVTRTIQPQRRREAESVDEPPTSTDGMLQIPPKESAMEFEEQPSLLSNEKRRNSEASMHVSENRDSTFEDTGCVERAEGEEAVGEDEDRS